MSSNTVAQFAIELKMPANVLLEQLRAAGVDLKSVDDNVTDGDKARLLESLRRSHGATEGKKITLTPVKPLKFVRLMARVSLALFRLKFEKNVSL